MSKVTDFWKTHTDADGKVVWPDDSLSQDALARKLFGACFVEALDYWLTQADDIVENPAPPTDEPWRLKTEDPTLRPAFKSMSEEQRSAVRNLVRSTAQATLFSSLVRIDQNPREQFEVKLVDGGKEGRVHPIRNDDLHDELYDWVWEFSVYRDLLMLRSETDGHESVRWKTSGNMRRDK